MRWGWGVVRDMGWFLDTLLGYVMTDCVDVEFRRLKNLLGKPLGAGKGRTDSVGVSKSASVVQGMSTLGLGPDGATGHESTAASYLDFTTLRNIHNIFLERLLTGCSFVKSRTDGYHPADL